MARLLTPKLDFVFKKLFCEDTEILTDLINSVLDLPEVRRIRSVRIKNPIVLPEEITHKFIVLDILATDKAGNSYEIEMQARQQDFYPKRSLYYASKIYAGQLDSGQEYDTLRPVIAIHFLDYEQFPDYKDDFHFCFEMRDIRHPKLKLTDDMAIHIFELPKFENVRKKHPKDVMKEWLHFFNHAHEEDETMKAQYKNPAIRKAFTVLETLSADEKNRYLAEIRENALKNERSELASAERRGIEKGRKEGLIEAVEALLSFRFGDKGSEMMPLIQQIRDCDRLRSIKNAVMTIKDISELKAILRN